MILAADPGASGALAVLHDDGTIADCWDVPTVAVKVGGKTRNRISVPVLASQVHDWQIKTVRLQGLLENVGPMPHDGSQQAFGMGYAKGILEGIFTAFTIPYTLVTPATWKRALWLTSDKGASRMLAMRLWPESAQFFARVKDADRAEACLLAHYGLHSQRAGLKAA